MPRMRVTQQHLDSACARLNLLTENSTTAWTPRPDGSLQAQVGRFYIESAYGGWKLVQMVNPFGGMREPLGGGYTSRRDLLNLIHAMIAGVEAVQAPVGKSCRETV
jgi:hypothetical protein